MEDLSPTESFHCVDCIDGLTLYPVWEDGSGICLGTQECMDGTTGENAEVREGCACEDNCQMCCIGGFCESEAPNTCVLCKNPFTMHSGMDMEDMDNSSMTGACVDVSGDDFFAEMTEYYYEMWEEYYGEEDEDEDDEASANSIKTGLAAVTMAVMLQF